MIRHFDNLRTPLRSICQYPQLPDQAGRFLGARWSSVSVRSLWDLWSDDSYVPSDRRLALNDVEPFDEWEEFVLFASHYFLLLAANTSSSTNSGTSYPGHLWDSNDVTFASPSLEIPPTLHCEAFPTSHRRRFGALAPLSENSLGHHGGLGLQTRLSTTDVYVLPEVGAPCSGNIAVLEKKCKQLEGIEPRMCHTITFDRFGFLIAGGRASPDHAFQDCWLSGKDQWQRIEDLPIPLFRHCATTVALENPSHSADNALLIYGGKTAAGHVSDRWLLWRKGFAWVTIPVTGYRLKPRFGAVIQETGFRRGILLGGMANDGKILSEAWEWTISGDASALSISFGCMTFSRPDTHSAVGRVGASLVKSSFGFLLVGGVSSTLLPQSVEIIKLFCETTDDDEKSVWNWVPVDIRATSQRPLLIGHSTLASLDTVDILGGGAVCFSFGTFWNDTIISISICGQASRPLVEAFSQDPDTASKRRSTSSILKPAMFAGTVPQECQIQSSEDFARTLKVGHPVVMRNMDIGSCTEEWTLQNLTDKIGEDRTIVVHEASDRHMDFNFKNFKYAKKPFKDFVDEIIGGSPQYLRSVSFENPAGKPADIFVDFPEIASGFRLPPQLDIVKQKMHSSVLRISGPVTMWLVRTFGVHVSSFEPVFESRDMSLEGFTLWSCSKARYTLSNKQD